MAFRQVSWLGPSTVVGGDAAFSRVSAQWRIRGRSKGLTVAVTTRDSHPLPYSPVACPCSGADQWSSKIKWRRCSGLTFTTFASLRLSENRRLNEEAHFSPRRQGAKWRNLFLKNHKPALQRQATSA
jgi:hypothetical protein